MHKAPAHPPGLEAECVQEYSFIITVRFWPPNTTPLIQPMGQQVISNFKKLDTCPGRFGSVDRASACGLKGPGFDSETKHGGRGRVSPRTVQSAWKKLWPESIAERDLEGFEDNEPVSVVEDIVPLSKSIGLEVDDDDVEELGEDHNTELTTKELQDHQREQQLRSSL
ncbi:hypothetical protein QTO34_008372 [Cnephaeus nilssonii]|uniref:Uncharacterized protein n=1 Tax=Cnephaeus nilssonii TaxID=3371016 RepID=A0AA40IA70_CNENI|nr:hypothetical protein QTO34_008372 [Eptesicus nilssonii]